jgi:hypothetical protein
MLDAIVSNHHVLVIHACTHNVYIYIHCICIHERGACKSPFDIDVHVCTCQVPSIRAGNIALKQGTCLHQRERERERERERKRETVLSTDYVKGASKQPYIHIYTHK